MGPKWRRWTLISQPQIAVALSLSGTTQRPPRSLEVLSFSDIAAPAPLRPPALGAASSEQERFREEADGLPQSLFALSAAPGTVRTCEAALRATAPKLRGRLTPCVLPMESQGAPLAFFAAASLLGPKSPASVTEKPAAR